MDANEYKRKKKKRNKINKLFHSKVKWQREREREKVKLKANNNKRKALTITRKRFNSIKIIRRTTQYTYIQTSISSRSTRV